MKKALIFLMLILTVTAVFAQQKFALVIGNANYTGISTLRNPVNDANDMEAALRSLGFTVEKVLNGNLDQMETAITNFTRRLGGSRNSYGFFYYAGHGVQSAGENYLIPINANNIQTEAHLRQRAVSVQTVMDNLSNAGNELNVIVLDACRDNPFGWARSGSRGLSVVNRAPTGSIVMYATSANSTAEDGTGRNGTFTTQLLNSLKTPGLSVQEMFNKTGEEVVKATNGRQHPEISLRFFGTAYLGSRPAPQPSPSPSPTATPQPTPAPTRTYNIGDTGPAGGIVFYDRGFYGDGWRYLEAAPAGAEFTAEWGGRGTDIPNTNTSVGFGKRNTQLIIERLGRQGNYAALLCANLDINGYKDWFLPSKDELNLIYTNLKQKGLGGFENTWYWSSSQYGGIVAGDQYFANGNQGNDFKDVFYSVRAVRAF